LDGRSEGKLVAACRSGERSAYAGLVKAYTGRVFAICLGILGNADDAEDVAQQALLKGFTAIGELEDSECFGAWIGRIAKNLCTDFLRSQDRGRKALLGRPEVPLSGSNDFSPLQAALKKLPEDYRVALMLYYFDGRSSKNIAEALEISRAAVHTRMSRARKRLRKLLTAGGSK